MKQNIFKFHFNKTNKRFLFCVSERNHFAYKMISKWPNWDNRIIYIYGPKDCGKTLLSEIWSKKSNAINVNNNFLEKLDSNQNIKRMEQEENWLIENIDKIIKEGFEEKILNFINIISQKKGFLLITSRKIPKELLCSLKDLLSRLNASLVIEVKEPNEDLIQKIILKHLELRQIQISKKNLSYLLARMERTYSSAINLTKIIDEESLESHSNISIEFLKKILKKN